MSTLHAGFRSPTSLHHHFASSLTVHNTVPPITAQLLFAFTPKKTVRSRLQGAAALTCRADFLRSVEAIGSSLVLVLSMPAVYGRPEKGNYRGRGIDIECRVAGVWHALRAKSRRPGRY